MKKQPISYLMISLLFIGACSNPEEDHEVLDNHGTADAAIQEAPDASPRPAIQMRVNNKEGGKVVSQDKMLAIDVPAKAFSADLSAVLTITVEAVKNAPADVIGSAYEIGPSGTIFSQPVTLTFSYDPAWLQGKNPSDLRVATVDKGVWQVLADSVVVEKQKTVSATTKHFSVYGLTLSPNPCANKKDGDVCEPGKKICVKGICLAGCYINGIKQNPYEANSANSCQICKPESSTEKWTWRALGEECEKGTGKICRPNMAKGPAVLECQPGCFIGGQVWDADEQNNKGNTCQVCKPAASTTTWSYLDEGKECDPAETETKTKICINSNNKNKDQRECKPGCSIGGKAWNQGDINKAINPCEVCNPSASPDKWSYFAAGTPCDNVNNNKICANSNYQANAPANACMRACYYGGRLVRPSDIRPPYEEVPPSPSTLCTGCVPERELFKAVSLERCFDLWSPTQPERKCVGGTCIL